MKNVKRIDYASFPLVIIGDTHGFIDDFQKQKEVLQTIHPKFVLVELLENKQCNSFGEYRSLLQKESLSPVLQKLLAFCVQENIKAIGLDLKHFGLNSRLQDIVNNKTLPTKEDNEHLERILKKRQKHHISMIKRYLTKTKSLVVILGAWHLQEYSPLMKAFAHYLAIFPCDTKGRLLLRPPKNGKVRYSFKQK